MLVVAARDAVAWQLMSEPLAAAAVGSGRYDADGEEERKEEKLWGHLCVHKTRAHK